MGGREEISSSEFKKSIHSPDTSVALAREREDGEEGGADDDGGTGGGERPRPPSSSPASQPPRAPSPALSPQPSPSPCASSPPGLIVVFFAGYMGAESAVPMPIRWRGDGRIRRGEIIRSDTTAHMVQHKAGRRGACG